MRCQDRYSNILRMVPCAVKTGIIKIIHQVFIKKIDFFLVNNTFFT